MLGESRHSPLIVTSIKRIGSYTSEGAKASALHY